MSMRIVYVGAVRFSLVCLRQVLACGGNVVGIVTAAEEIRHRNADSEDLRSEAEPRGIPVVETRNINQPDVIRSIRELSPDVIFVFGFSQLIGPELLSLPRLGCVGSHPALLPRNRGRHPLIWALIEDLEQSGLTFFFLDEGADSGDILWQRVFPVTDDDDAGTLYKKVEKLGAEAISEFLPKLENGTAERKPQDHSTATYWRKRTEGDGEINWASTNRSIWNLIRALTRPYIGAHTWCGDRCLRIWRSEMESTVSAGACGRILSTDHGTFQVKTGDGVLRVLDYEMESKDDAPVSVGQILGRSL